MASLSRPSEFDFIKKYMRPLSKKEIGGGLLLDDAAVLSTKEKQSLVVTMDTLVSGVHFLETTPPQFIASKILRVNLSDLAAMGANPEYYTLSISILVTKPLLSKSPRMTCLNSSKCFLKDWAFFGFGQNSLVKFLNFS